MTRIEFDDWYDVHAGYFPGVRTWFGNMDPSEASLKPHAKAVTTVWYQYLKLCELADCVAASQRLYEAGGRAPHYERHPQAIRAIVHDIELERAAAASHPEYVDGEQVFVCPLCQDDGRLICWHPKSMKAARDGTLGEAFTVYSCAVACTCLAGNRHSHLCRYDETRWLIYSRRTPTDQSRRELIEFMEAKAGAQQWQA